MSHYLLFALIPAEGEARAHVERLMAPYNENGEDPIARRWDFWQIGGRWQGILDGYDPKKDPKNQEPCWVCEGTGRRRSPPQTGRGGELCNGCNATGTMQKWPTLRDAHPGDVQSAEFTLASGWTPFVLITPDGKWHEKESWNDKLHEFVPREGWDAFVKSALEQHSGRVVVVDYHS